MKISLKKNLKSQVKLKVIPYFFFFFCIILGIAFAINISADLIFPDITFVSPTLANGSATVNTSVEINVSILNAQDLREFKWNWNGTNYSAYDENLWFMMNFDNVSSLGENDTHVVDLSGHGNNGTVSGGNYTTPNGRFGGAMQFDGSNDYVKVLYNPTMNFGGYFTMSAWVKTTNTKREQIMCMDNWQIERIMQFRIESNNVSVILGHGGSLDQTIRGNTTEVNDGVWHNIVYVHNVSFGVVYVDGKIDYIGAKGWSVNNPTKMNLTIGVDSGLGGDKFSGYIDEIKIYNRSLSIDEVQELYMSSLNKYAPNTWNFYINQSKNATQGLSYGKYTYYASAKDTSANENLTEKWEVTINPLDNDYPIFSNYWDNNASLADSGTGLFNVTLLSTNGTVLLQINNTNYTATNLTADVYNVSVDFSAGGVYPYRWYSWGNGTSHNFNKSELRSYTINVSSTCTYTSGDWVVNCADNCSITTNTNVDSSNGIILYGIGYFEILANISTDYIAIPKNCQVINKPNDGRWLIIRGG